MKLSDEGGGLWGGVSVQQLGLGSPEPSLVLGAPAWSQPAARTVRQAPGCFGAQSLSGPRGSRGLCGDVWPDWAVGALLPNFPASTWGGWAPLS